MTASPPEAVTKFGRRTKHSRVVEWAGRFGFVAMGISYGLVAVLAILVSLDAGGKTTDREGALQTVAQKPFGHTALLLLAVGFAGYMIWRLVEAFLDRNEDGTGPGALFKRVGYFGKAAIYAILCWSAFSLAAGSEGSSGSAPKKAAEVLSWPAGTWLVIAIGLGFIAAGGWNAYRGLTRKFKEQLRLSQMSYRERKLAIGIGVAGFFARAVVFTLVGVFAIKAAIDYNPQEAIGLDGALQKLAAQTYGTWLLGTCAAGLLAYGLYCLIEARYRRV